MIALRRLNVNRGEFQSQLKANKNRLKSLVYRRSQLVLCSASYVGLKSGAREIEKRFHRVRKIARDNLRSLDIQTYVNSNIFQTKCHMFTDTISWKTLNSN